MAEFNKVIIKAKTSCEASGNLILDHFVDVNKTIKMPKGVHLTNKNFSLF